MDRKELKKALRDEFDKFLKVLGFYRKSAGIYVKVSADILYIITFEIGSIGFTCRVAMQPLYIQYSPVPTSLHLSFGNRLSRFKIIQKEWWSFDEPMKGISEIKELLNRNGLPWFDQYGTPRGVIDFISSGKVEEYGLWFEKFHQQQYLGFSLLYIGQIEEGIQSLQAMCNEISENAVEFMKEYKIQINSFIDMIKKDPNSLRTALDDIVQENRTALKIKM